MEQHHDVPQRPSQVLAQQVRAWRDRRGLSAQQLADRIAASGGKLDRQAISKIEVSGRGVRLEEWLQLAYALGVPPLTLVFPAGREQTIEVLPGQPVDTWRAAKWFTGEAPFPRHDSSVYVVGEDDRPDPEFEEGVASLRLLRDHDRYVELRLEATTAALVEHLGADAAQTDSERESHLAEARTHDYYVRGWDDRIRQVRLSMRRIGLGLPPLPHFLRHLDAEVGT